MKFIELQNLIIRLKNSLDKITIRLYMSKRIRDR